MKSHRASWKMIVILASICLITMTFIFIISLVHPNFERQQDSRILDDWQPIDNMIDTSKRVECSAIDFKEAEETKRFTDTRQTMTLHTDGVTLTGEYAGDIHRPEGYNVQIGSGLALKLSVIDDPDYTYRILLMINKNYSDLETVLADAMSLSTSTMTPNDFKTIVVNENFGFYDFADWYYAELTKEQIISIARSQEAKACKRFVYQLLYVGSGEGDVSDMNWETNEGINTFCELNGDMFIMQLDGSILAKPDVEIR